MSLNINIPEKTKKFKEDGIKKTIESHFNEIANEWWRHQISWTYDAYDTFKDHDKFLIVIYLIKKTLDTNAKKFKEYSINQFYTQDIIELEKFNIVEVSNYFGIPKETTRRKLIELEKKRIIIKIKKKQMLNTNIFNLNKQTNLIKKISTLLFKFSKILKKNKLMNRIIEPGEILKHIEKEFTFCLKLYYDLQLKISCCWKGYFNDLESFNIWALCVTNKSYNSPKEKNKYIKDYSNFIIDESSENGLNGMTISDMTGIPRATVVRKLKKLIINKNLIMDNKKRYHPNGFHLKKILLLQNKNIKELSSFMAKIFNQLEN